MKDTIERLRHCSENTTDEYLHELTGRAADEMIALRSLLDLILAWDATRNYIMPYRLRDPIREKLDPE